MQSRRAAPSNLLSRDRTITRPPGRAIKAMRYSRCVGVLLSLNVSLLDQRSTTSVHCQCPERSDSRNPEMTKRQVLPRAGCLRLSICERALLRTELPWQNHITVTTTELIKVSRRVVAMSKSAVKEAPLCERLVPLASMATNSPASNAACANRLTCWRPRASFFAWACNTRPQLCLVFHHT